MLLLENPDHQRFFKSMFKEIDTTHAISIFTLHIPCRCRSCFRKFSQPSGAFRLCRRQIVGSKDCDDLQAPWLESKNSGTLLGGASQYQYNYNIYIYIHIYIYTYIYIYVCTYMGYQPLARWDAHPEGS